MARCALIRGVETATGHGHRCDAMRCGDELGRMAGGPECGGDDHANGWGVIRF